MRTIDILLLLSLNACDTTFGLIGDPGNPTVTRTRILTPQYVPGKGVQCTTDEQCGNDLLCYKQPDSYVGLCAKISE